jgi:hypothetical protein
MSVTAKTPKANSFGTRNAATNALGQPKLGAASISIL